MLFAFFIFFLFRFFVFFRSLKPYHTITTQHITLHYITSHCAHYSAGTVTADRVSGLKIGYKKGVFGGLGKSYEKGDWLVRFDTLEPALRAGLTPTVVVDRPVIQQILLAHGLPPDTVRIKSRVEKYEDYSAKEEGGDGIEVKLTDGTVAYADVLVGADGIWSSVRRQMHGLNDDADGAAASGAAGGALNEEVRGPNFVQAKRAMPRCLN